VTVALVLVLVACVAIGVWDLFSNGSRAPLRAALICEGGLLLGAVLQLFTPAGFVVGAIAGLLAGIPAFVRWARGRVGVVDALAGSHDDGATSLLELHDHLDRLHSDLGPGNRALARLALGLLAALGVSMVVVGLLDDVWLFLPTGSVALFLPVAHLMRLLSERHERQLLEDALAEFTLVAERPDPVGPE